LKLAWAAAIIVCAACSSAVTPSPIPVTRTPPFTPIRATFPPTWTPTDTGTPYPPTETNTPAPTLPPTATIGPEQIEEICDNFTFTREFDDGENFGWDKVIGFIVETQRTDVVVRFLAVHRATGDNQGVQLPGGQLVLVELPVNLLPSPGIYDWTISVHHNLAGDFCTQSGYFFASRFAEGTEEPEATDEATDEPVSRQ
jgi:hypothetical protein